MSVANYTDEKYIKVLSSDDKFSAIEELAGLLRGSDTCGNIDALIGALKEREEIMSTGIGFGIAIPHAKIPDVKKITFVIGISRVGIDFDSMDGKPVHLILLVAAGASQHKEYLSLLSGVMAMLKKDGVKDQIISEDNPAVIMDLIKANS